MPPKRKSEDGDGSSRPKKMSKEEKAAAKERARKAMESDTNNNNNKKKKKATSTKPTSTVASTSQPPPKSKKEERDQAKERARVAMASSSTSPAAASRRSTRTATSSAKKPPASSSKVTIKDTNKKGKPKEEVTICKDTTKKGKPKEDDTMPLPPTSLNRSQSTPLELELEHQVMANSKAAMEGKPLPFTEAPPDHLLKFAPTELEEGYDHNDDNAKEIDEDDDDDEAGDAKPLSQQDITTVILQATSSTTNKMQSVLPSLTVSMRIYILVLIGWMALFWKSEGTFYKSLFHSFASKIPLPKNPYRTVDGLHPLPFHPCFRTNVDHDMLPTGVNSNMRPDCLAVQQYPGIFRPCPTYGECWAGDLQQCRNPQYLQPSSNGKACELTPQAHTIFQQVVGTIRGWTFDHKCKELVVDSSMISMYNEIPTPHMMVMIRGHDQKQPMFDAAHILDLDPFLLKDLGGAIKHQPPLESLWGLVEAGNAMKEFPLKLKMFESYHVPQRDDDGDDDDDPDNEPEPQVTHLYALALVPPQSTSLWVKYAPLRTQCRYRYVVANYGRWALTVMAISTLMIAGWLLVAGYFWHKAVKQQALLQSIETVRMTALQVLQSTAPQSWPVHELKGNVAGHLHGFKINDAVFENRIWPRVVFDIRGDPNVHKSVILANASGSGGSDMVDVWQWQPRELATAPAGAAAAVAIKTEDEDDEED